jgi:predicted naringenin-chalcone synthase
VKVIGAGFGRTGTMSLKVALEELGAGPCFHCLDSSTATSTGRPGPRSGAPTVDPGPSRLPEPAAGASTVDWRAALAGWGSTVGWLGARFYREMLDVWPDALVLLSVRDPDTWYASCRDSIYFARETTSRGHMAASAASPGPSSPPTAFETIDGLIWDGIFEGRFAEREHALSLYARHNEEVMSTVPRERLLVYEVEQGWEPLSAFLGVASPVVPFPHLNSSESFRARLESSRRSRSSALREPRTPGYARQLRQPPRARRQTGPRIAGLAVADSAETLSQEQVLELLGLKGDEFAERIFARCGVQRRHLNLTPAFLADTLQGRAARVEEELMRYSIRAVDQLGVDAREIGTVVSASLYSLGCPTLAQRLVDHYGMDPSTDKYHITGVGCASAVPLMRLAAQTLHEQPGRTGLVVAAESMSSTLMRATAEDPRAKTVGSAIFGDGCAAALISGDPKAEGPMILASQVHQIGGTLGAVSLTLSAEDSHLHLARELPGLAAAGLGEVVERFLARNRLQPPAIDHWIVHPGGKRIIECARDALELSNQDVMVSWDALAEHGNVGTPSIFYVLKATLERCDPRPGERGLMVTIGPGVTVGLMLLQF